MPEKHHGRRGAALRLLKAAVKTASSGGWPRRGVARIRLPVRPAWAMSAASQPCRIVDAPPRPPPRSARARHAGADRPAGACRDRAGRCAHPGDQRLPRLSATAVRRPRHPDPADPAKTVHVPAGGAEHMATLVKQLRDGHPNSIFVAAGDLIGASPFLSAMFHDEPTIESLSLMGLALVGGRQSRIRRGQDRVAADAERRLPSGRRLPGSASVRRREIPAISPPSTIDDRDRQDRCLPPYEIHEFEGIPVAFIGLTLKNDADDRVAVGRRRAGIPRRGRRPSTRWSPELKARGVEAIVVLIHEGGFPTGGYNECPGISGPIVDIVKKFDKAVDLVDQRPHPPRLQLRDRRAARHQRRQIRHAGHRDRPAARSDDARRRQRQGRQPDRPHTSLAKDPARPR